MSKTAIIFPDSCPFCGSDVLVTRGITKAPFLFFKCQRSECGAIISFDNEACNLDPVKALDLFKERAEVTE